MHARDTARTPDGTNTERAPGHVPAGRPAASRGGDGSPLTLSALQRTAGNAAVVQMLRRTEQSGPAAAQEAHRHGAGCGHLPAGPASVQRSAVHEVLRSGGRPLDDGVRTDMEARLGADFSEVRVHTDSAARTSAAEVGARAYTSGHHVVIGEGGSDQHTLAHELTHVIQQRQGPVAGSDNGSGLHVSDPSDRFEREAEANASRVMSAPVPQESRPEPAPGGGAGGVQRAVPAVQRMRVASGTVAFTNVSAKYPEYHEKASRIIQLLTSHTAIMQYINGRTCEITLEQRTTDSPADVTDKGDKGVFVTLASYYFENYGMGHIAGMLCHEFGIHPLAESKSGLRGEEAGFRGMPFPVPGLEGEERGGPDGFASMNSDKAKQADHVLGAIPGSPRFTVYRDVTLEMADLLLKDVQNKQPGAREQDVTDLIDCFLMDIASIAATNDDRTRGLPVPGTARGETVRSDIAKVYNRYKQRLAADALDRQRIVPLFPQDKTPQDVKDDFNTLLKYIAKGKFWAWSMS